MARLSLNKSTQSMLVRQLKSYRTFLPSLDLKRRQLLAEREKTRQKLREIDHREEELRPRVEKQLPMLGYTQVDMTGIVRVTDAVIREENIMGIHLPKLDRVEIQVAEYPFLGRPHWVDCVVPLLKAALEIRMQRQVIRRRLDLLVLASKVISQRVNLFERVLIPRTAANIQRIRVYLSDAERASIVRAKIAKGGKGAA